jgi:ankyrin repeat protein
VNAKTNFGLTALMSAAGSGRTQVVEFLIDKGADIKAKDNNTWTALIWASSEGHKDAVEVLKLARDRH